MKNRSISVIVPVYNSEKYIDKALRSLFCQTMVEDVEFIIVNDCSSDNSLEVINKVIANFPELSKQIILLNHSCNRGAAIARQTGIDNSSGEYTIHMDSDDWCEPKMLERLYVTAVETDADIVYCDYYINFPRKQIYRSQLAVSSNKEFVAALINGKIHGSTCNKLVRRRLYVDNDIKFLPGINVWEDLLISIKLAFFSIKLAYLPQAFLHYMQVNSSSYTSYSTQESRQNIVQSVDEIAVFLKNQNVQDRFEKDLIYRKLYAQSDLLRYCPHAQQIDIIRLYQDIPKRYILSNISVPIYYRIPQWLASYRQIGAANLIYRFITVIKSFIR